MKKILFIVSIMCSLFTFFGCHRKPKYNQKQLKEMMISDEPKNYIVDVRTWAEYNGNHIPRAVNAPLDEISEETMSTLHIYKDDLIIVYCNSGNRSKRAKKLLESLGYKNVYDFGSVEDYFRTWEEEK